MSDLLYQIRDDLIELFSNDDNVKKYYEDYQGEYNGILVKEIYELYPEIRYPCITIEEIENMENETFCEYDRNSEFATDLGYRIAISSEETEEKTANENIRILANIIKAFMRDEKYKALRRIGSVPILPNETDTNIKTGYLTYNCTRNNITNTLYRRY